jgi:putative membrane protein
MGFSFIALFAIQRTRTGAAKVLKELISNFNSNYLILILLTIILSGIISFYLTKKVSAYLAKEIEKIDYTKISIAVLIVLILIVTLVSGLLGLIIFVISTFTGLYSINLKVRKINMMGALIIPTILFYIL